MHDDSGGGGGRKSANVYAATARKVQQLERRLARIEALLATTTSPSQDRRNAENQEGNDDAGRGASS